MIRYLIFILDYLYLLAFFSLENEVLPIYYIGFLFLAKTNTILFGVGKDLSLNLNLKQLLPWSLVYFLVSAPLFLFDGLWFWVCFNLWTFFMYSIGYSGFLILFDNLSIFDSLSVLWCRFREKFNWKVTTTVFLFANLYLFLKIQFIGLVPLYILPLLILAVLVILIRSFKM